MKNFLIRTLGWFLIFLTIAIAANILIKPAVEVKDIQDVKVTFTTKKIYIDVFFTKSFSCPLMMKLLDIQPFDIKDVTYFPTCEEIDYGVTITYNQNIKI